MTSNLTKTDLYNAASTGDLQTVKRCVQNGIDVDAEVNGKTALRLAVEKQHLRIVEHLLSVNADVNNTFGESICSLAIRNKRNDILRLLLLKKPNLQISDGNGQTPLLWAIKETNYNEERMDLLIKGGADVNYPESCPPIIAAIQVNRLKAVVKLVQNGADVNGNESTRPLLAAISKGNLDIVKYLVGAKADINLKHRDGTTCLLKAKRSGQTNIMNFLIEIFETSKTSVFCHLATNGVTQDVNTLPFTHANINATDSTGNTPLTIAIKNRKDDMAKILVARGADVCKYKLNGQTPLSAAVEIRNSSMVTYLLDHGATPNLQTAFRKAIEAGYSEIVKQLKDKGASINAMYRDGYTPLTTAIDEENLQIVKYLRSEGANINECDGNGRYPLAVAASRSNIQVIMYLIDEGANVELAREELEKCVEENEDMFFALENKLRKTLTLETGSGQEEAKKAD